ncbi:MAG: PqqD family protein [Caldilineaceae bacterium]
MSRFDADQLHVLNPVAYQIWLYCDGRHAPADIAALVGQRFPTAPPHRIAADVEHVLAELAAKGLLQNTQDTLKENQS